ncbi:hypothetical protein GCM10007862_24330 [Dyella lipolytica]|uniref:Flagellar hook-length control protein FliK n=1 Tax=Dyella lipolytica TaxID=1867835 RepID=A0ABW8IUB3_9GAMM|nr:flagellar hook-length control protein FliK [Dyella lipolytica]GLQ47382.1 hypothetical protein GCM10007862_24330 [Dyella lipolytica]
MSAGPLPAIQTPSPQSGTAKPATAQGSQRGSQTAFDTHLQNAQHDQTASPGDTRASSDPNVADQNGKNQTPGTQVSSNQTGNAKPGDASTSDASQADAMTADSEGSSVIASLAGAVLSLIDQSAGDASSGGTTGTKSTSDKQTAQNGGHSPAGQASSPALPITPIVLPSPVVPPASPATKGNSDSASNANASVGMFAANSNATANAGPATALSPLAIQESSNTDTSSDGGGATSDDGGAASATVDSSATLPAAVDSTQALASMFYTGNHAASTATNTSTTTGQNQNTPDLAALRGVLDTTAVAVSSGTSGTGGHSLAVNSPVGSSGFARELGQHISWLSGQEVKQAQIRLNPQDLGPLDVKVSVDHGRVDVAFMTQHPAATAAVQQGLDQLNQMLGGQGLSLGHATVGQHAQQQFGGQQEQHGDAQAPGDADETAGNAAATLSERVAVGLVDAFA